MMKRSVRVKTLLLTLVLLLSFSLSACGGKDTSTPDTVAGQDTQSSGKTSQGTEDTEDTGSTDEESSESVLLKFQTTDLDGNTWTQDNLADYDLIMINMWEYWCGPCVGEMPDLQRLYEAYSDKGFTVLGVYSDPGEGSDVSDTVESTGVKYPILASTEDFDRFRTNYVPTTIFVNGKGEIVGETYVGAKSYDEWTAVIEELLP